MPQKRKVGLKCPICKKAVTTTAEDFPFCSERCRLLDLGKWASGEYKVSSPVQDISDEFEGTPSRNAHDDDEN